MNIETKVQTYRIDKKCDKCKDGILQSIGIGITQMDSEWEHVCLKCGDKSWIKNKNYPFKITKDISKPKIIKEA